MLALKHTYGLLILIFISVAFYSCGTKKSLEDLPDVSSYSLNKQPRRKLNDSLFFKDKNSLRKNEFGQWELVAFGNNPYDLGNTIGELTQELLINQEQYFFEKVKTMVPSEFKQNLLRKFLVWYGRKMYLHIPEEYKAEMYGISKYGITNNELFGSNYLKTLFLHGAHDIGHALQDLALVGCSSFAVWDDKTPDGNLIIARNFDFYAGDEFAKEKLISFIRPEEGYAYMAVSWAGMIGVMSGMNDKGLTVTINAGKSDVPMVAKTPISLVTREVLQYASTLEEAIAIARKREVFVSEAILVGSAIDNNAVVIEMSPDKFDVFKVENSSQLICSNHFQSDSYQEDKNNLKAISESHSKYRYERMEELLSETDKITPQKAVSILRNREGLENLKIGYGNEKALNQLLAHHGIVFQPAQKKVWVSANPYQLGEFVAFQLDSVFDNATKISSSLSLPLGRIKKDVFLNTIAYSNYEKYRLERSKLEQVIKEKKTFDIENLETFIALNPEFWEVYYIVGTYYYNEKNYKAALSKFEMALSKEITTVIDKENVEKYIKKTKRKLNDS